MRTPRARVIRGSSSRRAAATAASAESAENMAAARRGAPIRCRSPQPFRRHQLTALTALTPSVGCFAARLESSRIDRDEQDALRRRWARAAAPRTPGGTNTGGHKQNTGRGSAMPRPLTCCPALCSTWPRGWARGSSPRTRRCHLHVVREQVERRVRHLRRTRRSDVAAPILCRRRRSKLGRPAAARTST